MKVQIVLSSEQGSDITTNALSLDWVKFRESRKIARTTRSGEFDYRRQQQFGIGDIHSMGHEIVCPGLVDLGSNGVTVLVQFHDQNKKPNQHAKICTKRNPAINPLCHVMTALLLIYRRITRESTPRISTR
jgi:hypothetical protein